MYPYDDVISPSAGTVGAAPPGSVLNQSGLQLAVPSAAIYSFLKNLFLVPSPPVPAPGAQFIAQTRGLATAAGADTTQSAFDALKSAQGIGQIIVGNVSTAGPERVDITIFGAGDLEAVGTAVPAGSDFAILDLVASTPATSAEKKKAGAGMLVAGALAGGTGGFLVAGPVGGVAGAIGGAVLANWIA